MDHGDIHTPSIPSSIPNGISSDSSNPITRDSLLKLIQQKDDLEAELKALGSVLESHNVTMTTTLTTFDGYPRDDIDIAQIRTTRARIIRLRNDYKALMSRIEIGLHTLHAAEAANPPAPAPAPSTTTTGTATNGTTKGESWGVIQAPFARVNSVESGSPAEEAGLRTGDLVKVFGGVNVLNHERLTRLADEVGRSVGREIRVVVGRKEGVEDVERELRLVPRTGWGGRGSLGCHIVPL